MSESMICDRSFEFAVRIIELTERMWNRGPGARHVASQLIKCGTSIGANAEEAQEGQSKADFRAKYNISRKEARETRFWLRLAIRTAAVTAVEMKWELDEVGQLLAMLRSAVLTSRRSSSR